MMIRADISSNLFPLTTNYSSHVANGKVTKPAKKHKKMTPCGTIKSIMRQSCPEENFTDLLEACRSTSRSYDSVYRYAQSLLRKDSTCIFSLDAKGFNALHCICSSPKLLEKAKLLQLLINTSKNNSTESLECDKKDDTCLLLQETKVSRELPIHLACKNASFASLEVFEYLIKSQPNAVYYPDKNRLNLPLHNACIASTEGNVPLEVILLLVQQWPKSCEMQNLDGNLPLHLASKILQSRLCLDQRQACFDEDDIDTLDDIKLEIDETEKDMTDDEDDDEDEYDVDLHAIPVLEYSCRELRREMKQLQQKERNNFKQQLEVIQYLVDMYPDGLRIRNKQGLTPLEVALGSLRATQSTRKVDVTCRRVNHPITLFLGRYPASYMKPKISSSIDGPCDIIPSGLPRKPSFVVDVSGHEFDEVKCYKDPWHLRRNSVGGRRLSVSSGHMQSSPRRSSLTPKRTNSRSSLTNLSNASRRGSMVSDYQDQRNLEWTPRNSIASSRRSSLASSRRSSLASSRRSSLATSCDAYSYSSDPMLDIAALEDASDSNCQETMRTIVIMAHKTDCNILGMALREKQFKTKNSKHSYQNSNKASLEDSPDRVSKRNNNNSKNSNNNKLWITYNNCNQNFMDLEC